MQLVKNALIFCCANFVLLDLSIHQTNSISDGKLTLIYSSQLLLHMHVLPSPLDSSLDTHIVLSADTALICLKGHQDIGYQSTRYVNLLEWNRNSGVDSWTRELECHAHK